MPDQAQHLVQLFSFRAVASERPVLWACGSATHWAKQPSAVLCQHSPGLGGCWPLLHMLYRGQPGTTHARAVYSDVCGMLYGRVICLSQSPLTACWVPSSHGITVRAHVHTAHTVSDRGPVKDPVCCGPNVSPAAAVVTPTPCHTSPKLT